MRILRILICGAGVLVALSAAVFAGTGPHTLGSVSSVTALENGIRILTTSGGTEEITALRDDVVRVRASTGASLPEDASWAVLEKSRTASVPVTPENTAVTVGFRTQSLHIEIDRKTLCLTVRNLDGRILQQDAQPLRLEDSAFRIAEAMPADEHYYGLGDKTGPTDRRGRAFSLWNTDAYHFQESTDPLYKSIPFFMSFRAGTAVGVFLDNTFRSSFDFGAESATSYSFGAADGPVDYYIFPEPAPRAVLETYAWLTGKPPLAPRWSLGFQQSRYTYTPESRLMEIADRLRADRIPADALYLDIDFQDRNRPFTINTKDFANLGEALAKLHTMNFHVVAITDLHIAHAPDQNYAPYDSGVAGDQFVHNPDGSVFVGPVWPGPAVFPDFTRTQTRAWWGTLYKDFIALGFDGFWNDMNEPSIFKTPTSTMPLDVVHRIDEPGFRTRTAPHAEIHNVFGMENSRATYEGLLKLEPNTRPFVLTRASYAGGQRYAATWTGDNTSTWNHLRESGPQLKSLGLSGFGYSGADVGGFAGTATADLLTKWLEVGAFEPIDRDHTEKGTGDQEPWVGGSEQEDIRRRFIEARYRLMPYLYTLAEETSRTGIPMMRPLFLDYPEAATDKHPMDNDVDNEFLLGHDLLVAPSPFPDTPDAYSVEFPTAEWFDYWTGERVEPAPRNPHPDPNAPRSPAELVPLATDVHPTLDALPVYVRGGAILALQPLVQSTQETPHGPLELHVYAGSDCRGSLYTDDGSSFAYKRGEYLRQSFTCFVTAECLTIQLSAREGSYTPWWKEIRVVVYGWQPRHGTVRMDGATNPKVERVGNTVLFTIPASSAAATLEIE
ncbi:glycoside hydrolase family 31 protein [Terracidiphilus gabretensis]|uniref:glycoside hydrolase family 31 protein n=1 Tax=Terracidiphilus gabretensis TaxID=1577687 RepID=UPI00071B1F1B|nr:TIM-barrel domain-containing protein [Terracidiphilus gabretensis]